MYSHIKEHVGLEYCAQMPIYLEWYASKTLEWSANVIYSISKNYTFTNVENTRYLTCISSHDIFYL